MPTWKFTTTVLSRKQGAGEFYGEVAAPTEEAAKKAVTESAQADGHACGPVQLKPKRS